MLSILQNHTWRVYFISEFACFVDFYSYIIFLVVSLWMTFILCTQSLTEVHILSEGLVHYSSGSQSHLPDMISASNCPLLCAFKLSPSYVHSICIWTNICNCRGCPKVHLCPLAWPHMSGFCGRWDHWKSGSFWQVKILNWVIIARSTSCCPPENNCIAQNTYSSSVSLVPVQLLNANMHVLSAVCFTSPPKVHSCSLFKRKGIYIFTLRGK